MKSKKKIVITSLAVLSVIATIIVSLLMTGYKREDLGAKTITGTLTKIAADCQQPRNFVNGEIVIGDGNGSAVICDGGSYIMIDEKISISTSSGFTGNPETTWGTSIKNFNPGDIVEVRYLPQRKGDDGNTSCSSCYVKLASD